MEELRKQVRRAYRRLGFQRFVGCLAWCWFATLLVALGLIATDRLYPISAATWGWAAQRIGVQDTAAAPHAVANLAAGGWAAAALLLGLLVAMIWIVATRRPPLDAAIEIDRRFGLKERVSSTLALGPEDSQTEAGRALVDDAVRHVQRIDVATQFAPRPGKRILLPLLPGLPALLVALLISPAVVENQAKAGLDAQGAKQQVKKSTEVLRRQLADRRKAAEKLGLKDAEQLFKRIEEDSRDMAAGKTDRDKALVKLNDLARDLKQRRDELGDAEKTKQQLDQLKNIDQGPADKFAKAIGQGDFKAAGEELKKMQDQLADGKLNKEDQQKLAKQLEQMQQKVAKLAEANQAAKADLQNRIDKARQAGEAAEADKLQQDLDKLMQQAPQMDQLKDLAQQMGQCAKCLRDGQPQDAADALEKLQAGVNDMQQKLDEMEMLEDAMGQMAQAKQQMNCPMCGGAGCQACQGDKPGVGMGRGRGQGDRPEADSETSAYDSQVRQRIGAGAADVVDLVDGPNVKGNVEQQIKQQFDAVKHVSADPQTDRNIPRQHRQQAREYFDRLREGE